MKRSKEELLNRLFSTELGLEIYNSAVAFFDSHGLTEGLKDGVLVGLSGGADSVMLLMILAEYSRRSENIPLIAVHVNHGIRDEEAERDARFSEELSRVLSVEFISKKYDVPSLAQMLKRSLEEAARDVRYAVFKEIISGRSDVRYVALAHNSSDNMETVLLNVIRGSGSRGASGIPPIRDNVIRPLIEVSKEKIKKALDAAGIPYVTDSTNLDNDYRRNYIRNKIVPLIKELSPSAEDTFSRLSDNLRSDDEYISSVASQYLSSGSTVKCNELSALHSSVRARVLSQMAGVGLSKVQLDSISSLLSTNNFCYSVSGDKIFFAERGELSVRHPDFREEYRYSVPISLGATKIEALNLEITVSKVPILKSSLNIYKKSIQARIPSAIIEGGLRVRNKTDGDTIFYGGITRKLKKLFSDRKIPASLRDRIPVLCDEKGPLWLPGYGVREDKAITCTEFIYVTMGVYESASDRDAFFGSEFK